MPRRKPYGFDYYLIKNYAHAEIIEEKPQCENCEHMNYWAFSPDLYDEVISKKYCPSCPVYDGKIHKFTIRPLTKGAEEELDKMLEEYLNAKAKG